MPIRFEIFNDVDLAYFRWEGEVNVRQYRAAVEGYTSHPLFRSGRPELIDTSGLRSVKMNFREMLGATYSAASAYNAEATRCAVWAPSNLIFPFARMMQQLAETTPGFSVEIFRSEADALTALGFDIETIAELRL